MEVITLIEEGTISLLNYLGAIVKASSSIQNEGIFFMDVMEGWPIYSGGAICKLRSQLRWGCNKPGQFK